MEDSVHKTGSFVKCCSVVYRITNVVINTPYNVVENIALILCIEVDSDSIAVFPEGSRFIFVTRM